MNNLLGGVSIVAALAILSLGGYCYYLKYELSECQKAPLVEAVQTQEKHEKIQQKVMSLDDAALNAALCKWVRDDVQECRKHGLLILEGPADQGNGAADRNQ